MEQAIMHAALGRQLTERFPVFAALPAGRLEAVLARSPLVRAPKGAILFDANQPCRGFPLLLEGAVRGGIL